jgi:hypothetical protein
MERMEPRVKGIAKPVPRLSRLSVLVAFGKAKLKHGAFKYLVTNNLGKSRRMGPLERKSACTEQALGEVAVDAGNPCQPSGHGSWCLG